MKQVSKAQAGFTLVELVIVILILGILSAVALPRFVNLGSDARRAKAEAIYGSARSAAQIVRAAALVRGATAQGPGGGATSQVDMDGVIVQTNFGYPEATVAGIISAAGLDTTPGVNNRDKITWTGGGAAAGSTITITMNGATTPATCSFTYQSPAAANTAPTFGVLQTAGC